MEQFGKYQLIRKIGTGGMAEVFLARATVAQGLAKILVIKKIHSAYARNRQFGRMFQDEANIALGLNHPNIIQVFDYGQAGDTFFLAMEYVEGMDLLRLLQEAAKARVRMAYGLSAYIVQQVAKGLDYAHRKAGDDGLPLGIVHRDISPQNVLLSWDGAVKIVDFGIARARTVSEEQGVIKGKFAYMSPEQARGEPVDCRSDVFAAGIVLYELVCARPLFHGKGKEALEMVKAGAIPRPRDFAPELPESLERTILRALAFHRADRFQTARDLQHELGRFQLEWAQKTGALIDSGSLAQQLAQLVAPAQRVVAPRPPAEGEAVPQPLAVPPASSTGPSETPIAHSAVGAVQGANGAAASAPKSVRASGTVDSDLDPAVSGALPRVGSLAAHARPPTPLPIPDRPREARERKYVYVLQGILRGMAALDKRLGGAGAARLVNEFYKVARDVAYKHDALLDLPRLPADGKDVPVAELTGNLGAGNLGGETIVRVVVGLPVSGEGDAGRAIRLALALVDALDGIGSDVEPELRLALAVQRGTALVRRVTRPPSAPGPGSGPGSAKDGSKSELVFEVEDATAAFAHKLARQARGAEILVGGRVYRAARAEWNFEALPAIDLPEAGEPTSGTGSVPSVATPRPASSPGTSAVDEETDPGVKRARVYRLRGPKERAQRLRERHSAGRLHGRELELKALRDGWRDVLVSRRKRQVLIVGDAGVGKRMLVRTFLEAISPADALVIRTTARVGSMMQPYGVIADLARDALGLAEDAEPHEVERRLLRAVPLVFGPDEQQSREARTAVQIFGMLLGARSTAALDVDAETRRRTLMQILIRIESRLEGDKPLILVGEDVHWADQDSQELFAALLHVDTPRPLFGVMTSRPEPRIIKTARELGTEVLVLDELPDDARAALVAERFVPGHDIRELVTQIAARAGGNAFFINELLDTLVERGIVVADPDNGEHPGLLRWVKRDAPIHVPSTVEDLLLTRIDGLPQNEKDALVHAAVLGRHVSAAELSHLVDRPVRLELDELVRRGLLTPADGEYRFKNDMTMTVAYGLLPQDVRVQKHRTVAARIANAPGYRLGQDDALIARHLELAGDNLIAAERYLRAAGHAVELGANADAFRQLTRTLKLLPETNHDRRFAVHRLREEIARRLAKRPQQLRELHALRKEAEAIGDPGKLAIAHCAIAQFYIDVGKAPAALRAVAPAIQYARDAKDPLAEGEALRLRAAIARLVGNAEESLRLVEQALELVGAVGGGGDGGARPPTNVLIARATILNQRGTTLWNIGRLEQAIESYAEGLVIYRAVGMVRQEARALSNMGVVFAALGEYEEALAHYMSALKIDEATGDRSGIANKLANIGQCYSDLGDVERAESFLDKALQLAEQTGDLQSASDAAVSWGQTKLQRGDVGAAIGLFERGLALATENRDRYQEVRSLEYIALARLTAGEPAELALEMARSATEWARKMPMMVGIVYGLTFQAMALSRLGRHDEAVAASLEALAVFDGQRPEGSENVFRWNAVVLAAAGRGEQARAVEGRAAAEVEAKAAKLRDPELRAHYLRSRTKGVS